MRLLVLLDVERGQELGVEVARREAEARPVVIVDDPHDVGGAHLIDGARDAVLSMVVRRDGERPGAQPLIGAGQVSGRAVCRGDGIAPLVDRVVHLHVEPRRRRRELPDARRPHLRIRSESKPDSMSGNRVSSTGSPSARKMRSISGRYCCDVVGRW